MHYYTFNIGDHIKAAGHLTVAEDGLLRRLIDIYLLDERPLVLCLNTLMKRTRAERLQRLKAILAEFFTETKQGYRNEWCDAVIAKYHLNVEKNQRNARKRQQQKNNIESTESQPTGIPLATQSQPTGIPLASHWDTKPLTNNQEPKTNNQEPVLNTPLTPLGGDCVVSSPDPELEGSENQKAPKKPERVKTKTPDRPPGVSEQVWSDFLAHRKSHRASLTETALRAIEREAGIAGMSLEAALTECVVRGWRGFKAEWMVSQKKPTRDLEPVTRGPDFDYTEGGL